MTDLHRNPPMSMARVHRRHGWLLPLSSALFSVLAVLAAADAAPWDEPITNWAVGHRGPVLNTFFRRISFFGSTPVALAVAAVLAHFAYRRCPRLALAIIVIALARPLIEHGFKEFVGRERPDGDRMVNGRGPSFPSGHPLAMAASWSLLPLVVALYTRRRVLWWAVAIAVWSLAVLVAASRVYLGVHWATDVVGSLALAVLGVAAAERFIDAAHGDDDGCGEVPEPTGDQPSSVSETTLARS